MPDQRILPELDEVIVAMEKASPNRESQKAITPEFLRCLALLGSPNVSNYMSDHAVDLLIGAFFFAMRSCEFSYTSQPGLTKMITLDCVTFFSRRRKVVSHLDPNLFS